LKWFVDEQVEEERSTGDIVERLKMVNDQTGALLMLDAHLGQREAG
jgi:ferritin